MTEHFIRVLVDCDNVFMVVRVNGENNAQDFLASLAVRYRARYQRYFEWLRDGHSIKSPENIRHLKTLDGLSVWELKVDAWRLYAVKRENTWYLTHGRRKPKDSKVRAEIDHALNILGERLQ
jgi:hypothetical protein